MLVLPIWLWLVLIVIGFVIWLVGTIGKAGAKASRDAQSRAARAHGQALPIDQGTLEQTQRALAGYVNQPPETLAVLFAYPAVNIQIDTEVLTSPLLVMATTDVLCIRSRQGASDAQYRFIRKNQLAASGAVDAVTVRYQLTGGHITELHLAAADAAQQVTAWLQQQKG